MDKKTIEPVKTCKRCGTEQRLNDFYKARGCKDGHRSVCKTCSKAYSINYINTHRKKWNLIIKKYRQTAKGRATRKRAQDKYLLKNKQKHAARCRINCKLRRGTIQKQPCIVCNTTVDVHGHHEDYSKPLEVTWLCREHHNNLHNSN